MENIEVTRTFDLLERLKTQFQKDDILACKKDGQWIKYSVDEYYEKSHKIASAFLEIGLKKGDKVITIMNNRPEWNIIDMGLSLSGLIHVPIYTTMSSDDYKYIVSHSDAKMIIAGSEQLKNKIIPAVETLKEREIFICSIEKVDETPCFSKMLEKGEQAYSEHSKTIENNKRHLNPEDIVTIIYTSGTTGTPKGVMLTHSNIVFNFLAHAAMQVKGIEHKMLSFLPLCHIYERSMNYEYQYLGISTYYAENIGTIASDLNEIHADGFCAVPRVLEMMFDKLRAAGKDMTGLKKRIYFWAFKLAEKFDYKHKGLWYETQYKLADKLVYSKWREKLGGKEMLIVAGGASIQPRIIRLFSAAKQYIFEGYGMTETSPVIAVNNPKEMLIRIGTVGKPIPKIEVKIAEDGEILTKGPHVMLGYYKDPEYTSQVIDLEGWLHTGDIGEFDKENYLKITDRKKEIFKLSAGKYIAPQMLENIFKESSFIENIMVIGENQKFASAIIIPNFSMLHFWAAKHKVHFQNNNELIKNPKVVVRINKEIDNLNNKLAPHEQIKRFRLISEEWTPQNGSLSQTLKLKRNVLKSRYAELIEDIYSSDHKNDNIK